MISVITCAHLISKSKYNNGSRITVELARFAETCGYTKSVAASLFHRNNAQNRRDLALHHGIIFENTTHGYEKSKFTFTYDPIPPILHRLFAKHNPTIKGAVPSPLSFISGLCISTTSDAPTIVPGTPLINTLNTVTTTVVTPATNVENVGIQSVLPPAVTVVPAALPTALPVALPAALPAAVPAAVPAQRNGRTHITFTCKNNKAVHWFRLTTCKKPITNFTYFRRALSKPVLANIMVLEFQ